ncbi:MAG: hypothetical protein A3C85_01580 [Candidatus Doudnabacteria bacterium RIFCSPHIGHO2_02_FULL_48_21]|uniref:DUF6922 domain-containing protein n=1 Tax=Candidatus Doudnabacteria bacterium RIFCSPLOWO2_02_FULL_48_13 TaxID=1817845 RepID=A0A1F5Q8J3_9BACT|nr:MAG: hypothetical protein A3C85_01580 [Candidatus Doudnabacteria bacterium RIFCSPHIGHO2_02_FULL_48_21]OGE98483.1 MAG: hypothetical protein A3J05_04770 [Candidatus Doudnabacteria bacterium RIFCSPLOWO2_02_FULL_48_13]
MVKRKIHFRPSLFWDVDPKTIDPKKHAEYIIERILDFGFDREIKWMWNFYPKSLISKTVKNSRAIFPFTKSLWLELVKHQ